MRVLKKLGKGLLILLAAILLLVVLVLTAAVLALRSETGTAWMLDQIEGLTVAGGQGSLVGTWQAEILTWQGYGVGVEVRQPYLSWAPGCLLQKRVCVNTLLAKSINVTTQPAGESQDDTGGPITLPLVDLPVAVVIGDVRLGTFELNGTPIWQTLELTADGSGSALRIDRLHYEGSGITATVAGNVTMRGDWPLNLDLDTTLPAPTDDDWSLDLTLAGSVADLRLEGTSQGYLEADLDGRVKPLRPELPASLNLKSGRFLALDSLPATLALENWRVAIDGTLAQGFDVQTRARLPGEEGPVQLDLKGLVTPSSAQELALELSAPYVAGKPGTLALTGSVNWAGALTADARVDLDGFPWQHLAPMVGELPVTLKTLNGSASYNAGSYQAELAATTEGPVGETSLETSVAGDLTEVRLDPLRLEAGPGQVTGKARLGFAEQLAWQAELALASFNPGFWLAELEADLSGQVTTSGEVTGEGLPDMTADWQLDGTWRGEQTRTAGKVTVASDRWNLEELALVVGPNRITGQGQLNNQLQAALELDLPELSMLLPGLAGRITGDINASGQLANPSGRVRLSGAGIRWQDQVALADLKVNARLSEGRSVEADIRGQQLEVGGQTLSELALSVSGSLDDHALVVRAVHPQATSRLRFAGGWDQGWQGAITEGRVELPQQNMVWNLADRASLAYTGTGRLTLGEHCWVWQDSRLCAADQTLLPSQDVAWQLTEFPSWALAPLLPPNLRWQAAIDASVALTMTDAGPDGRITVDAAPGEVSVKVGEQWQPLNYDTLNTTLVLRPQQADLELTLAGPGIGDFNLGMTLDPSVQSLPVEGRFTLNGLDVGLATAFVDLETIAGRLNGSGQFQGPLRDPRLQGELVLSEGRLADPDLPTPFEALRVAVQFNGRQADIEGRWRANGEGQGRIDGQLSWQEGVSARVSITGSRLPFTYEPYARLEMAPDLQIAFSQGNLGITGSLGIPRGEIEVRQLPPQAVSVSGDEVVVGEEPEQPALEAINMDVTVNVGEDEVSFSGFGVTGDLKGSLRIGNNMDTRGSLRLVDGSFQAYGQELRLRRARLVFVGPVSQPYLDIEAVRKVGNVVAGLRLSGPATEPTTEVFSEPPMPENEALAYLVLGRPLRGGGDDGQLGQAALALGLAQTSELTRGIGEEVGIRDLQLETEGSGEAASVVASGYVSENLSVRYGVGVFEPITKVALRYDLGRYFYLEAASGLAASLDLFYTRDF
ncbi:MAG: translocation/assembly module TamB domain-containing protein [Marinobacter sp.]|uniref:translocation/assembly module TamB domain-containing protein n=1 Tax=Marinobacter sp. TaxID=50741 RepID=UPI00299D5D7E|nr:translocation/assembly module TamB domain-containing protein [Marinobacter sp.]MDX1633453.1 translocation/assembly module TamB domain-containing protein [Marinobacter sp.]